MHAWGCMCVGVLNMTPKLYTKYIFLLLIKMQSWLYKNAQNLFFDFVYSLSSLVILINTGRLRSVPQSRT